MNAQELWTATQNELENQVTRAIYEHAITPTLAIDYDDKAHVLSLAAPNNQVLNWLRDQCDTAIRRAASNITGAAVIVSYQAIPHDRRNVDTSERSNVETCGSLIFD